MNDPVLIRLVAELIHEVRESRNDRKIEFEWYKSHCEFVTKCDLKEIEAKIMDVIESVGAAFDESYGRIVTAIDGLSDDIKALNDKITELQNSPGTITPAGKAILDSIQNRAAMITERVEKLDAMTAPVVPPIVVPPVDLPVVEPVPFVAGQKVVTKPFVAETKPRVDVKHNKIV